MVKYGLCIAFATLLCSVLCTDRQRSIFFFRLVNEHVLSGNKRDVNEHG